jgi:hypothetical protein
VTAISRCSIEGCGHVYGYTLAVGSQICWVHAEKRKLPAHMAWLRAHNEFMATFAVAFRRTATKRDNYGVLGHR